MKVRSGGEHVGYLNSSIEMTDAGGQEELILTTKLSLQILFQGRIQPMRFQNQVRLNPRQELMSSESSFFLAGISGKLNLTPEGEDGDYQLDLMVNDIRISRQVSLPDEAIISSPLMDQVVRNVRAGQTLRIRALDPFSVSGELQTIEVRGIETERVYSHRYDQFLEVTLVESQLGDMVMESSVDEYGRVLWQKTPFGITLVDSTSNSAVQVPEGNALDPAALFSAPLFNSILSKAPLQ